MKLSASPALFSASLEIVLAIAYREAASRRHAYLTLEHLLYAQAPQVRAAGAENAFRIRVVRQGVEQVFEREVGVPA